MAGRPKKQELKELTATDIGAALVLRLSKEVQPAKIAAAINELISATAYTRTGAHDYAQVPDYRAREAGVKLYLSYMLGMPVQRVVTEATKREDDGETMKRMLASPAAREALKRALAEEV